MGGYGSGRGAGDRKRLTDDYKRIDVLWMKREGILNAGKTGLIQWTINGYTSNSIKYAFKNSRNLRLKYKILLYDNRWRAVDYLVKLNWEVCHFGGRRPYFLCPNQECGRRVQHLYAGYPYFVCRHCLKLAYPVQRELRHERLARKANKIRRKLSLEPGVFNDFPIFKPKGMHQSTWDRLRWQLDYYNHQSVKEMATYLDLEFSRK